MNNYKFSIEGILFNPLKLEIESHGQKVKLTQIEFGILCLLADNVGMVVSRKEIIDAVWPKDVVSRTVDVHMTRLRKKLPGLLQKSISTMYTGGYVFEKTNE